MELTSKDNNSEYLAFGMWSLCIWCVEYIDRLVPSALALLNLLNLLHLVNVLDLLCSPRPILVCVCACVPPYLSPSPLLTPPISLPTSPRTDPPA